MSYVTIEAEITNGQIIPKEGVQLPEHGRALVTLLPDAPRLPNWKIVKSVIGALQRPGLDSSEWQNRVRSEWDTP